jgi:DNA invertase Pin-like site-specific DNA recombinase
MGMMANKIQAHQLQKNAYVYLRQSTMRQVYHNQESTERQYALKDKALILGWKQTQIFVLDGDLGESGAKSDQREDFKKLIADVCMEKAGAIFALEASRLSRSCADWHRLLNLCALTNTLIIDDDGIYDPSDFNDQLVLGLKGTMSQAELHVMRGRLLKAKMNKAQKGKLRFPLPVGFCYDDSDQIIPDIDKEVRGAVSLLFSTFKKVGTARGVAREFAKSNLKFPKRAYGGVWNGKVIWGELSTSRVLGVLKNPSYAGAYVFGRHKYNKQISPDGEVSSKIKNLPMENWTVHIQDHHKGYITWEEFQRHQVMLQENQTNTEEMMLSSALRDGHAILQGLLVCGNCGHKISPRYKGKNGLHPMYECNKARKDGQTTSYCMGFRADVVDQVVVKRVLEVLGKDQIEIAISALNELESRDEAINKQWTMKLERAEYEAQLAQRRYEQVDPDNRLVASSLEKTWNETLFQVEQIKQQRQEQQSQHSLTITSKQKEQILLLAQDLPNLWNTATTQVKDRKRVLHLLIKDITVCKNQKRLILHLRWQGGATEDLEVALPPAYGDKLRYKDDFVARIRDLSVEYTDDEIAEKLNTEGQLASRGNPFTRNAINWIRHKYRIPSPHQKQKRADELTVNEVARKFNVSIGVVYYWISRGFINTRRLRSNSPYWITITSEKEEQLRQRIAESYKL